MRTEWRALRVQHAEKIQYTLSRHVANGKVLKQKERENAAVVLQKLYHDVYNKMRKMAELLRLAKEQNCALKIQRLYRGILARRRVVPAAGPHLRRPLRRRSSQACARSSAAPWA